MEKIFAKPEKMEESLHDRLKHFIESNGDSMRSFEDKMKFSHNRLAKPIKNRKIISSDMLEKIFSEYPNLNANWLFKGIGPMFEERTMMVAESQAKYLTRGEVEELLNEKLKNR